MESTLTKNQTRKLGPRYFRDEREEFRIFAKVRFDDSCGNGHNTFSVTADIDSRELGRQAWREWGGGCCHGEVCKHFPEIAHLIRWHLCSTDEPMHYVANAVYLAGDRDCWGLLKGEVRQLRNGKTGQLCWKTEATQELPQYVDANECPPATAAMRYVPWNEIGKGKERDLDAARRTAVWPEASDEELMQDREALTAALEARLPALQEAFKTDVEAFGFKW